MYGIKRKFTILSVFILNLAAVFYSYVINKYKFGFDSPPFVFKFDGCDFVLF